MTKKQTSSFNNDATLDIDIQPREYTPPLKERVVGSVQQIRAKITGKEPNKQDEKDEPAPVIDRKPEQAVRA